MSIFLLTAQKLCNDFEAEVEELVSLSRIQKKFENNVLYPMRFYDQIHQTRGNRIGNCQAKIFGFTPVKPSASDSSPEGQPVFSSFGKNRQERDEEFVSALLELKTGIESEKGSEPRLGIEGHSPFLFEKEAEKWADWAIEEHSAYLVRKQSSRKEFESFEKDLSELKMVRKQKADKRFFSDQIPNRMEPEVDFINRNKHLIDMFSKGGVTRHRGRPEPDPPRPPRAEEPVQVLHVRAGPGASGRARADPLRRQQARHPQLDPISE